MLTEGDVLYHSNSFTFETIIVSSIFSLFAIFSCCLFKVLWDLWKKNHNQLIVIFINDIGFDTHNPL